jgi:hypothetical protein
MRLKLRAEGLYPNGRVFASAPQPHYGVSQYGERTMTQYEKLQLSLSGASLVATLIILTLLIL